MHNLQQVLEDTSEDNNIKQNCYILLIYNPSFSYNYIYSLNTVKN